MSYLVDALRKAERERLQGAAPGQATLAMDAPYDDERSGVGLVGWMVAILVVCNLVLFGYLLWPAERASSGATTTETAAARPAPSGAEAKPRTVQVARQSVVAPVEDMAPEPTASSVARPGAGAADEQDAGQAYPAAASQRQPVPARDEVPPVSIHGHMFSADPAESFILVGGRIYHEGERLPDGVAIVRIDQDGALLDYRGQRFRVNGPG